jgi:hypothetical protein
MRSLYVLFALLGLLVGGTAMARQEKSAGPERPNVVVILADDFGWGSLGCYGAKGLKTPNLDRLAREGRRFTQAYAPGSVCSPTRYGLMTGRYYWRTSVKDGEVLPGNGPLHIETDRLTLASLCKRRGYRTGAFGKWHLGMTRGAIRDWSVPLKPGPLEIGFDTFFGMASNPWSGPQSFIEDHAVTNRIPGQPVVVDGRREQATTTGIVRPWKENEITTRLRGRSPTAPSRGSSRTGRDRSSSTSRPMPSTAPSRRTPPTPAAAPTASTVTSSRNWTAPSGGCWRRWTASGSRTTRWCSLPATTAA